MGGFVNQPWLLSGSGLLCVLLAGIGAIPGVMTSWIKPIPDGLELIVDQHCFVIAGEWTVLISIDEPQPPPELNHFFESLQTAIRRNTLLGEYMYGWINRLRALRKAVKNPRHWWRTHQPPVHIHRRQRRALVDMVGHTFKFLFGTATEDEVEDIKRLVHTLADDQGHVMTLMDEFTTVVNHTYDEIHASHNRLNAITMSIRSLTNRLRSELSFLHQRLHIQERRMDIELMLQELESITHNYVRSHEAFLHRKENLEAGRLTENILSPEILQSILDSPGDGNVCIISPLQWYYENTAIVPIWIDQRLIYRARLPLVELVGWHHVTVHRWPVPVGDWQATILLPDAVLKDTRTGDLDMSPVCYGHRPRVCQRGLISRPATHSCMARLLTTEPAYDPNCTLIVEHRMPLDLVHPQAPNTYILMTNGTDLALRCEGQSEVSTSVMSGVYRISLEPPCSLYGTGWHLVSTFQRSVNVSFHTQEVSFPVRDTIAGLFTNLSDFNPLVSELKLMKSMEQKELRIRDLDCPHQETRSSGLNNFWHSLWIVPLLGIIIGIAVWLWHRQ